MERCKRPTGIVCRIEVTVLREGCRCEREEECWGDGLVDEVFRDVDCEEGDHAADQSLTKGLEETNADYKPWELTTE